MTFDEEAFMEHHGVKGMRWGVRKKRDSGSKPKAKIFADKTPSDESESKARYLQIVENLQKAHKEHSRHEAARNIAENEAKLKAKLGPPVGEEKKAGKTKGWRPTGDQVVTAAVGAAFVGLLIYGAHQAKLPPPGSLVDPKKFEQAVFQSKLKTWSGTNGKNYLQKVSFEQEGFELPVGHEFHRLSSSFEHSFGDVTYATHDKDDFHRYVVGFTKELHTSHIQHVTFKAEQPVRVPSLTHAIDTLHKVMVEDPDFGNPYTTKEQAMSKFASLSGTSWPGPLASGFFKKLSDEGYHGIVDHMDAGVIGDSPLVLFNHSAFSQKASSVLTSSEIAEAKSTLKELTRRKP